MSDNVTLPGTGAVIATEEVSSKQYQLVKPVHGIAGVATMTSTTNPFPVGISDVLQSAFGEVRTANSFALFDQVNKYDIDTREWGTSTATGGTVTHVPAQSAIRITVTGSNGSEVILRSQDFFRYQAGRGLRWRITGYHADTGQANQTREWGFFDPNDGMFFRLSDTTLAIVQRTSTSGSPVDTAVNQSAWNVDRLNGAGGSVNPSGVTLDVTKGNIYEAVFQWLGVGTVRYYVNGILVHVTANANTHTAPYMRTAQLPISMRIVNTSGTTTSNFTLICASVQVEGGELAPRHSYCAYNSAFISVTTERPVLSIRPKLTYNSITNRIIALPLMLIVSGESRLSSYRLVQSGSLTGASFSDVATTSGFEFDVSATALSGGETICRGLVPADSSQIIDISKFFGIPGRSLHLDAFGTVQDTLTVLATNETSPSTPFRASITFDEIR